MPVNDQTPQVSFIDAAGADFGVVGNPIRVDPTGTTTQPVVAQTVGTFTNGAQTVVDNTVGGVQIIAANANRKAVIIQNVGLQSIRVGVTGVSASTGIQLVAGATLIFEMQFCPTAAIFAIREGAVDSTAFTAEIT
jgi:hypothetical protein